MPTSDDHASVERTVCSPAMPYRTLGRTGLQVSALAFGAGPISTLMVGDDRTRQDAVVRAAVARGINWFDTAATYGGGQWEQSLGRAFEELQCAAQVRVATKVRLTTDDLAIALTCPCEEPADAFAPLLKRALRIRSRRLPCETSLSLRIGNLGLRRCVRLHALSNLHADGRDGEDGLKAHEFYLGPPASCRLLLNLKRTKKSRLEAGGPRDVCWSLMMLTWHTRGYLPHWDAGEVPQAITFQFADHRARTMAGGTCAT